MLSIGQQIGAGWSVHDRDESCFANPEMPSKGYCVTRESPSKARSNLPRARVSASSSGPAPRAASSLSSSPATCARACSNTACAAGLRRTSTARPSFGSGRRLTQPFDGPAQRGAVGLRVLDEHAHRHVTVEGVDDPQRTPFMQPQFERGKQGGELPFALADDLRHQVQRALGQPQCVRLGHWPGHLPRSSFARAGIVALRRRRIRSRSSVLRLACAAPSDRRGGTTP